MNRPRKSKHAKSNQSLAPNAGSRLFVALLSIGINVLALVLPLALLQVYDRILPNQSTGSAVVIFSAVVLALGLSGVLRYVRSGIFARWSALEEYRIWRQTADRLIKGQFGSEAAQLLASSPSKSRDVSVGQTSLAKFDAPFSIVFLALIAYLGGIVVAAPLLVAAASLLVFLAMTSRNRSALESEQRAGARFESSVTALANSPSNTTSLASLGSSFARLVRARGLQARSVRTTQSVSNLQMDALQTGSLIATVGVVWLGAGEVLAGNMTTGGLAACTLLGSRAASQLVGVAATGLRGQPAAVSAKLSKAILSSAEKAEDNPPHDVRHIFDNIDQGLLILEDSDKASAIEQLKSIVQAIPEALSASEGVRVVPARARLLAARLIENLSRMDADLEAEAQKFSGQLGLEAIIARLPFGYNTEVSPSGAPLPDGGVKRAAIVQAFVGSPRMVILEAPDAYLDVDAVNKLSEFLVSRSKQVRIVVQTSSSVLREGLKQAVDLDDVTSVVDGGMNDV